MIHTITLAMHPVSFPLAGSIGTVPAFILWVLAAYLLGAIPFGLLAGFIKGVDIRTRGSGNIGATNTIRILGKPIGLTVFLLDFGKGLGPTLLALFAGRPLVPGTVDPQALAVCCGAAAVVGHCYPVFLGFKGGKGVAAMAGVALALCWKAALVAFIVFFVVRKLTGFVSLSSMALAFAFPLTVIVIYRARAFDEYLWITGVGFLSALLIVMRHRSNIARILRGEESKVGDPDPEKL